MYAYAYGLAKAEPNIKMRLNNNSKYVGKMSIEIVAITAATAAAGAVQGMLLALVHHLEQEKVLVHPRRRLARLNVPYQKKTIYLGRALRRSMRVPFQVSSWIAQYTKQYSQ